MPEEARALLREGIDRRVRIPCAEARCPAIEPRHLRVAPVSLIKMRLGLSVYLEVATFGSVFALSGSSQLRSYTAQANRTRNCSDPDFCASPYLLKSAFISDLSASRWLASSFATIQSSCCLFPAGVASL